MTLAERLAAAMAGAPSGPLLAGDDFDGPESSATPTPAAVLVAITERTAPGLLLTRRAGTLRAHAGQVAFPGGRIDPGDRDATAAALREAQEEIGLDPALATVIGQAEPYRTVTGYSITPVVAVIPPDLPLRPSEAEVASLFEVPVQHLVDPANVALRTVEWQGRARRYREILWGEERIWGATAAMLHNLADRLRWIV